VPINELRGEKLRVNSEQRKSEQRKSEQLRALSLHQVRLLVAHVIVGVAEDRCLVVLIKLAAKFSWGAHPEGIRLDDGFLGDQGAGGDDRTGPDYGAIEDDRAHADEAAGFNFAAVKNHAVAHGDIIADIDSILFFHAVEDAVVLNVRVVADADLVDIAAEDSVHPDAGVFANNYVADELGGVVDIAGLGELGSDAFVGANHRLDCGCVADSQHIMEGMLAAAFGPSQAQESYCVCCVCSASYNTMCDDNLLS
jgi:hypothetical protein